MRTTKNSAQFDASRDVSETLPSEGLAAIEEEAEKEKPLR